ncbi:MAG: glycoside hydrolase family 5 protein [Saprospiraceae bacterium]|nr:glycoside hydrolase family 5 protein [Pyrinomonadaceae bacterium]
MRKLLFLSLILFLGSHLSFAQSVAHKRAERMGVGMNLSYLDNYWLGTKEKNFSDFVKPAEAAKREQMLADIAKSGFKTVRLPMSFGAWASLKAPYEWVTPESLIVADSFVKWALANNLNVIVDLHHTELDGSVPNAAATERVVSLWKRIAERYKGTDPERVFFELRNEPHDIPAKDWRDQAEQIIKTVRGIAPNHTLIVGFHDWNSRAAMIDSKPFEDKNIIYTFHYYDPFIFTHQGATWSSEGLPELKGVSFPWSKDAKIETPATAKGKWVENQINSYKNDSDSKKMFDDLQAAKDWSEKNRVPIFLGEFGSFGKHPTMPDRCRHAETVYSALGKLNIPSTWWEWDGGFNMFEPGTGKIADCMRKAIDSYNPSKQKSY